MAKYEKEDAMIDAIVAACTAGYSILNNSSRIKNLVTLLIISNIESAITSLLLFILKQVSLIFQ